MLGLAIGAHHRQHRRDLRAAARRLGSRHRCRRRGRGGERHRRPARRARHQRRRGHGRAAALSPPPHRGGRRFALRAQGPLPPGAGGLAAATGSPVSATIAPTRRSWAAGSPTSSTTGNPFCLVLMDLDDLKLVNDHEGHVAGDEMLTSMAAHDARDGPPGGPALPHRWRRVRHAHARVPRSRRPWP